MFHLHVKRFTCRLAKCARYESQRATECNQHGIAGHLLICKLRDISHFITWLHHLWRHPNIHAATTILLIIAVRSALSQYLELRAARKAHVESYSPDLLASYQPMTNGLTGKD